MPTKPFNKEPLLKRVSSRIKSLTESELQQVEELINSIEDRKLAEYLEEFGSSIGADRPLLHLVKKTKSRRR
ncbi:hypothetical protein AYB33_13995 [Leptospira santarosai]|uniref:hypothetical protein n=1 Tax=Leptospira santarosai TaxID=28183 RepID=UPI0007786633|nr:hypothetical protein [Leptospira santarosai]KXZ32299.1 hypothetical protein AYB33_13995 [Leptospira santarosai]